MFDYYRRPKDDSGAVIYCPDFFRLPRYLLVSIQNIIRNSNGDYMLKEHQSTCDEIYTKD